MQHGKAGEVVIRIRFTDFTGKVMFHCHIAAHEDGGMMSYVNVIRPRQRSHPPGAMLTTESIGYRYSELKCLLRRNNSMNLFGPVAPAGQCR